MPFKRPDVGLLLAILVCSFSLIPLRQNGLAAGYDVLYHTYRVAEMYRSWEAGIYMPRWAESFYYGFGSPVFHYYASSTYYLTSIMKTVLGVSSVDALRGMIVISLLGGGAGMYLFSRTRWGQGGGILAALVYVYSPYILYTEPYTRGDYPELFAFGVFPWVLWRFDMLSQPMTNRRILAMRMISASCLLGLLVITHNLMAVVMFALLVGWIVWLYITQVTHWRQMLLMILAAGFGIGVAAYFWLPVLLERDAVQLENLIAVAELDYRNFFIPIPELFSLPTRADSNILNGLLPRYQLGVAGWLLGASGAIGLIVTLIRQREHQASRATLYFAVMAIIMIFLITPAATWIWDTIPGLAFLQFPWRFLGPVAACLAILAGSLVYQVQLLPTRYRIPILVFASLMPLGFAIPYLYVPQWDLQDIPTDVAAYHQEEVTGRQLGTTFSSEFLPVDVFVLAAPNQRLLDDFADGRPVDMVHYEALPSGIDITTLDQNPHHNHWSIEADSAFQLEILTFDFPGWQAMVNGEAVDITTTTPNGFISFPVPAGRSDVELTLTLTTPRQLGYGITVLAILGLIVTIWRFPSSNIEALPDSTDDATPNLYAYVAAVIVIFGLVFGITFRDGTAWLTSNDGEALAAQMQVNYLLGEDLRLLGYDMSDTTLAAGARLDLALYWEAQQPLTAGYASFIHITPNPETPPIAQSDRQNPGGIPTKEWGIDGHYYDSHHIYIPDWLPAGRYQVRVGMWTCDGIPDGEACGNGIRPPVRDENGTLLGDAVHLFDIDIR